MVERTLFSSCGKIVEVTTSLITDNQQYLLLLAIVMALSFWAKKTQVFLPVYKFIASRVKSKRAVVAIISLVSGVLPINGRASVSAGALDTIAPNNKKRKVFGIIDYLSTHHYYFWSPLEATVLVPMAALSISYGQFMGRIWPLLVTALIVIFYYIFKVVKEDEVEINISKSIQPSTWKEDRKQIRSYATTLLFVGLVIILSNIVKANFDQINAWVNQTHDHGLLLLVAVAGFLASFALGSSGKFAGFTSLSASVYGIDYLPLFFAIDYAGYMLSPTHKCLVIAKSYFDTSLKKHYQAIFALVVPVVLVGILTYLTID
jgi:hypothetical protein